MDATRLEPAAVSDAVDNAIPARPWFVYLIECRDGSLYTGIAVDVSRRYRDHETGKGARYTRSHPPRRLAAVMACTDQSSALRAELSVKRLRPAAKRAFCLRNPPSAPIES
ncbi:hypothetical protein BH11PSE14_BH11PSE14_00230 [soil metagenome]